MRLPHPQMIQCEIHVLNFFLVFEPSLLSLCKSRDSFISSDMHFKLAQIFSPPHVRHIKRMTCAHLYIWKLNGAHSSKKKRRAESLLCSNRDLQWTPQSPHSAADSQHSCLLQCWETHSTHISLSPSLSPSHSLSPLSFSSSHHPPQPGRHCGPVCALFDVVLEVNRRRKHLTQLLNRERLNVS